MAKPGSASHTNKKAYAKMNCITLASELRSDDNGMPVEWTLLKAGESAYTKEGIDGKLSFTV